MKSSEIPGRPSGGWLSHLLHTILYGCKGWPQCTGYHALHRVGCLFYPNLPVKVFTLSYPKSHLLMYSTIKVQNGIQATLQGRRL
jgi:hypothetical protein